MSWVAIVSRPTNQGGRVGLWIYKRTVEKRNNVSDCIHEKMNGCDWRLRVVMAIDAEVKMRIIHINAAKKPSVSSVDSRSIASRIQQIRKQKNEL